MTARPIAILALGALIVLQAHARPDASATPAQLQMQTLDAVRRISELAIDQGKTALAESRRMFELANEQNKQTLERTSQIAASAIQVAKDSNEYTKAVFTVGTAVITAVFAIIVGAALWFGFKEYRSLRSALEERFKKELELLGEGFREESKKIQVVASRISTDIPLFISQYNSFLDQFATGSKEWLEDTAEMLRGRAKVIESYAQELQDKRTVSWVHAHYALLYYFQSRYAEALGWQKRACSYIAPEVKYDRERNLTCIAAKVFETTHDSEAFDLALATLQSLESYVTRREASELLSEDRELEVVFDAKPQRREALQRRADGQAVP